MARLRRAIEGIASRGSLQAGTGKAVFAHQILAETLRAEPDLHLGTAAIYTILEELSKISSFKVRGNRKRLLPR